MKILEREKSTVNREIYKTLRQQSCPHDPPRADSMFGAELIAPEARTAELALLRIQAVPCHLKDTHRTHINAEAAVAAEVWINVHFKKKAGG